MKRGTMKKAKDTRLLITYSTLTCLYCVIFQKKTCTSLLHHTKHAKHHDKMVLLSRIKNLNKRTETTGSFYFLLVLQNHWLGPLSAIFGKNTSDIHHLYHWSTKWSDCDINESIKWGRWLRNRVLLPYQRPQSGGAVSFDTHVYFSMLREIKFCDFCWYDRFGN